MPNQSPCMCFTVLSDSRNTTQDICGWPNDCQEHNICHTSWNKRNPKHCFAIETHQLIGQYVQKVLSTQIFGVAAVLFEFHTLQLCECLQTSWSEKKTNILRMQQDQMNWRIELS